LDLLYLGGRMNAPEVLVNVQTHMISIRDRLFWGSYLLDLRWNGGSYEAPG